MKTLLSITFLLLVPLLGFAQEKIEYAYKWKDEVIATDAPRLEGDSYRIELIKVRSFNPNDPDLKMLRQYGEIYPEKNLKTGMIRLMLGDYTNKEITAPILSKVRSMGFTNASLIKYLDGYREE